MMKHRQSRFPMRLRVFALLAVKLPFGFLRRKPLRPQNILVLHHLLLGDALMITALLSKLREQFPQANIHLALPKAFVSLYEHRPYGIEAIPFDPRDIDTFQMLRALPRQDWVLLPADNRYSWLARAIGGRWIIGFAGDHPAYKNWLVDELRPYSLQPTAWSDTSAELISGPRPPRYTTLQWLAPSFRLYPRPPGNYAVLHVGASTPLKHWPGERWLELAEWLASRDITPVWSAGPGEEALVTTIDNQQRFPSLAGQLDLPKLWNFLAHARLLVCPDTGIAHLGRIVGVPTVCLFGPGSAVVCGAGEFWGASPYRPVTIENFPCRDQNIQFFRTIPWMRRCERLPPKCTVPQCMLQIHLDVVVCTIQALLAQTPK